MHGGDTQFEKYLENLDAKDRRSPRPPSSAPRTPRPCDVLGICLLIQNAAHIPVGYSPERAGTPADQIGNAKETQRKRNSKRKWERWGTLTNGSGYTAPDPGILPP